MPPRHALDAYATNEKMALSGRALEASVLLRMAQAIQRCRDEWEADDRDARLTAALKANQKLWTLFQVELADPASPLPVELRRNLLQISAFVDRRTFEMFAEPSPDKLSSLIEINRNIAAGLSAAPQV